MFEPSTVSAYSNWGAALAGYIVERVSGLKFYEYVQQNIFAPLGMTHSALNSDLSDNEWVKSKRNDFVSYMPDGTLCEENTKVYILPYPAGMCVSTLDDFLTFAKALLTHNTLLLSEQGYTEMFSPSLYYTGTDKARICHGFLVDYEFSVPIIGHDGNTVGCSSRLLLDFENNIGMVVFMNQMGGSLYRTKMPELVFGKTEYHNEVDNYYMPARSVFRGKQKILYSLFIVNHLHITSAITNGLFINVTNDRLEISSTDYLLIDKAQYILNDVIAVLWFILVGLSAINLITRLVLIIIKKVKKQCVAKKEIFNIIYSAVMIFSLPILSPSVSNIVAIIYFVAIVILSVLYGIYLVKKYKEYTSEKFGKLNFVLSCALFLCFVLIIINFILWDLMV